MNTTQYLDAAKKALGIESDYALAKRLELTQQAISKLRNRHIVMSNTTAAKVAELLGVDLVKVIADLEIERGTNDELWKRIAKKVAMVLVSTAIAGAIGLPSPAHAGALLRGLGAADLPVYYVKLLRALLRLLTRTWWALVAGAALSSCSTMHAVPESAPHVLLVQWQRVDGRAALERECPDSARVAAARGLGLNACSKPDGWDSSSGQQLCTIYTLQHVSNGLIGEEFLHCAGVVVHAD